MCVTPVTPALRKLRQADWAQATERSSLQTNPRGFVGDGGRGQHTWLETAQQVKEHTALTEDLALIPFTQSGIS